jgi:hypothetical protein
MMTVGLPVPVQVCSRSPADVHEFASIVAAARAQTQSFVP